MPINEQLSRSLAQDGLVQFGYFGGERPFEIRLDWLASYPHTLKLLTQQLSEVLPLYAVEYLLCPVEALPIAIGLSLHSEIPLVYSRGDGQAPAVNFVGAYDVGHPTTLILNALWGDESVKKFIKAGEQVGLVITTVLTVIQVYELSLPNISVVSLLKMPELIDAFVKEKRVPAAHGEHCLSWLANHHPSSKRT